MPTHSVASAAAIIGVSASQIRNWCTQFADNLSPTANPAPGQPRQLTPGDVAILQAVKEMRSAGTPYEAIPDQLPDPETLPDPYIDARVEPTAVATAPNALESTIEAKQVFYHVEKRFDAIEGELLRLHQAQAAQAQLRVTGITTFGIGMIVGMVLILVIVGLFALASYLGG